MRNHGGNVAKCLRARAKGDETWDAKIAEMVKYLETGVEVKPKETHEMVLGLSTSEAEVLPPRHVRSSLSPPSPKSQGTAAAAAAAADEYNEFSPAVS